MVDPDPIMKMSRDTESDNGYEVLSPSKPNCIGLRECRTTKQNKKTQSQKEQICSQDMESNNSIKMFSQAQKNTKSRKVKRETNTIPIGDNEYIRPPSIHEKYAARPDSLEHICLAQFVIWYESAPKNSVIGKSKLEMMSDEEIICPHLKVHHTCQNSFN